METKTLSKTKCVEVMKGLPMRDLENLYYTYFVTCNAFIELASIVEEKKFRGFIISSFKKEFSVSSLNNLLEENGYFRD